MGEKGTIGYSAMKKGLLPDRFHHEPRMTATGEDIPPVTPTPWQIDPSEPDNAFNPASGENAVWNDDQQQWLNAQTGEALGLSGSTPLK